MQIEDKEDKKDIHHRVETIIEERPLAYILTTALITQDLRLCSEIKKKASFHLSECALLSFNSIQECLTKIDPVGVSLLILDINNPSEFQRTLELIYRAKTWNESPAVLIIADTLSKEDLNYLYSIGVSRCILKNKQIDLFNEIVHNLKEVIRLKKLEQENIFLKGKLTEINKKLQDHNRSLDAFSAVLAHDIKSPLAGLAMKLDYLLNLSKESIPHRTKELLIGAYRSTERLTEFVQSIYKYSSIGNLEKEMSLIDLEQIIEEVIEDIPFPKDMDVTFNIDTFPKIYGYRHLLQRIFLNLIQNSIKYFKGKELVIDITVEKIIYDALGKYVKILYKDSGPGIDSAMKDNIFNIYKRGSTEGEGLGIGLAIVKKAIEAHTGQINLEQSDQGVCFSMTFPLQNMDFLR